MGCGDDMYLEQATDKIIREVSLHFPMPQKNTQKMNTLRRNVEAVVRQYGKDLLSSINNVTKEKLM